MLFALGAMFLAGLVQAGGDEPRWPLRLGVRAVPVLVVVGVYAFQRMIGPKRRWSFVVASALVCGLGAALAASLAPAQRALDALRGLVAGAIVGGLVMPLDGEADALLRGPSRPWNELFFAAMVILFGTMPSVVSGGFVLTMPTVAAGLAVLAHGLRLDGSQALRGSERLGASLRLAFALPLLLAALGFLVVSPLLSSGWRPR